MFKSLSVEGLPQRLQPKMAKTYKHIQGLDMLPHSKQHIPLNNVVALQLCNGESLLGPDLEAVAQLDLRKGVTRFAIDNRVMNVQLLALTRMPGYLQLYDSQCEH